MGPVVICGFPRSGSTMLYQMIRTTVTNYKTFPYECHSNVTDEGNIITKRPLDVLRELPHRRLITIRDPRSVVTSFHSTSDDYFVSWNKAANGTPGLLEIYESLKEKDGYLLRYEDLISDPNEVQKELGREFGFEYNGVFSNFHTHETPRKLAVALNGTRPVDNGHDWRQHEERVQAQFKECPKLHDMVKELGYEAIP